MDGNAMKKKASTEKSIKFRGRKNGNDLFGVLSVSFWIGKIYDLPLCKAVTPSAIGCTVHTQMNIMKAYTLQQQNSLD